MSQFWNVAHPILPMVDEAMCRARAEEGEDLRATWLRLNAERDEMMRREQDNPLECGYEPPVWAIADALLGLPKVEAGEARRIRERFGFRRELDVLLINGGYRGGKTEWAAKRTVQGLLRKKSKAWCFMPSIEQSREVQQLAVWKYFPPHLKEGEIRTKVEYIAYKMATGFSENRFTLPNASWCSFRTYNQQEDNVEGAAPDWVWLDEPPDPNLVRALYGRIAERNGKMVLTFAPKHGFTGVVKEFMEGAKLAAESVGWLMPADGGAADVERGVAGDRPGDWSLVKA